MLHTYPTSDDEAVSPDCRWVDLIDPDEGERERVRDRFGVAVPTLDELARIDASSRLRADGDTLRMSAPLLSGTDTDRWESAPVGFILTPEVCITVRFVALQAFDTVAADIGRKPDLLPAEILTRLLEELVDRAADHLEKGASVVNDTSQSVFFDQPKLRKLSKETTNLRDAMRTIGQVSDRTSRVRYTFLSIGRVASFMLDRCTPRIEADIRERLEAVRHDIASLDEFEASLSARAQLIQDAATGFISIAQNDVVKVLTVVSVVGVPPVLIVGIYGMNFKNMPELSWHYGYPYALALCAVSVIMPLLWFKWRDWI
ncbi:magnesium transporter CorA family protein [Sphingomonas sp. PAMC 26605]|uniref:magnesium transporter CorA family protein n=1 Tax=Sphingomonas sp. PAMC 26605 TaxID=1112214 RepID=UPI00026CB1E5|nr:magnesium transporter CorA family protein [Sphingomonas sp. PAMC 26605]